MPVNMAYNGRVFGHTVLPKLLAKAGQDNVFDLNTNTIITSLDAFNQFGADLLKTNGVTLTIEGTATVETDVGVIHIIVPGIQF